MPKRLSFMHFALAGAVATALSVAPAIADKPPWAGGGHQGDQDEDHYRDKGKGHRDRDEHGRFEDRHRVAVHDYYAREYEAGHCPPGLAKKHNGCMPPGQAKKWEKGRPLPREVVYYDLPPALVVQIGVPPPGYRYVRVASDILMLAAATGVVVDVIQDLGRM
jgi:Ni/Co efflux regulator RcnB